MVNPGGGKHEALGVFLDGRQVRIVHLARRGRTFALQDMVEAELPRPIGEEEEQPGKEQEKESDAALLGLEQARPTSEVEVEEKDDPQSVLFNLLAKFPLRGAGIAFNLAPARARLSEFPDDFGLKGKPLARRVLETLREAGRPDLTPERVNFFRLGDGRLLSVDHNDPLPLMDALQGLAGFVGGRVNFTLVDAEEMGLLSLAWIALPDDDKVTALTHVGRYTTHMIFLRGRTFLRAATPVHLGTASPDIADTLARRLGYAQEEAGLPEPERVVLAGIEETEADAGIRRALVAEFPQAEVSYLRPPSLDVSLLEEKDLGLVPAFAVPIALAWKSLDPALSTAFPTNFLPARILEAQKVLRIAWHGFAAILITLGAVAALTMQSQQMMRETRRVRAELGRVQTDLAAAKKVAQQVNEADKELNRYTQRVALVDSLARGHEQWSRLLADLSQGAQNAGGLWFRALETTPVGVHLTGRSLYRDRVSRLEALFDSSRVAEATRNEIREVPVYDFDIQGVPHDFQPAPSGAAGKKGRP